MLIPLLTEYEKTQIGERQPLPERYLGLSDEEMDRRIAAARAMLGRKLVILGHHYQRDEVIKFADYIGDSYKLAGQVSCALEVAVGDLSAVAVGEGESGEQADVGVAAGKRREQVRVRLSFGRDRLPASVDPSA